MQKAHLPPERRYQDLLMREFEVRIKRNASYSLRAYARDLGLSVSSLSRILGGKQGVSLVKAKAMARELGLGHDEADYFCSLVSAAHARSGKLREHAKQSLGSEKTQVAELSLEYFKTIADWYHYAIIELTGIQGFRNDPKWISEQLGVSVAIVKAAIARLLKLELIEETRTGSLRKTEDFRATPSGIPNRAIQDHHAQLLKKAETALEAQSLEERDFSNVTFTMNRDDLDWAREEIKKFRRELTKRLAASSSKDALYQLSIYLFSLKEKP